MGEYPPNYQNLIKTTRISAKYLQSRGDIPQTRGPWGNIPQIKGAMGEYPPNQGGHGGISPKLPESGQNYRILNKIPPKLLQNRGPWGNIPQSPNTTRDTPTTTRHYTLHTTHHPSMTTPHTGIHTQPHTIALYTNTPSRALYQHTLSPHLQALPLPPHQLSHPLPHPLSTYSKHAGYNKPKVEALPKTPNTQSDTQHLRIAGDPPTTNPSPEKRIRGYFFSRIFFFSRTSSRDVLSVFSSY